MKNMEPPCELAAKLTESLKQQTAVASDLPADNAIDLAQLARELQIKLNQLSIDARHLIHAADSGFASRGKWVDDEIEQQNKQLSKLARATEMVAEWLGPDGAQAKQTFVVRGHIRGWAHRWRKAGNGPAEITNDPDFVALAKESLSKANIPGDLDVMIDKALLSDWRTA